MLRVAAIEAAGIDRREINGLLGANNGYIQTALGIPEVNYYNATVAPFGFAIATAVGAISSGQCDVLLAYHSLYRTPAMSRSAANDPFRLAAMRGSGGSGRAMRASGQTPCGWLRATPPGPLAISTSTTSAATSSATSPLTTGPTHRGTRRPRRVEPFTMDDYLQARMIRWPLCVLDMDIPVDGADAFIITTTERARDMALPPVLIHACTTGQAEYNEEDQAISLRRHGQHVVIDSLRSKSDYWLNDFDLLFPYDGFSFITVSWLENIGFCGLGEGRGFIEDNWDSDQQRR